MSNSVADGALNKFPGAHSTLMLAGTDWDTSNVDCSRFDGKPFIENKLDHRRQLRTLAYQLGKKKQAWTVLEVTRYVA